MLLEWIMIIRKIDLVDVFENCFVKYVFENFLKFCIDINDKVRRFKYKKMEIELELMIWELEN